MTQGSEEASSAIAPVMTQDVCFSSDGIDYARWLETVFLPLTLVGDGKAFVIDSRADFIEHLQALEETAAELGIAQLRTSIVSAKALGKNVFVVRTIRERLDKDEEVIGRTLITWTVIKTEGTWKINQILFDDAKLDPSVVAKTFLGY